MSEYDRRAFLTKAASTAAGASLISCAPPERGARSSRMQSGQSSSANEVTTHPTVDVVQLTPIWQTLDPFLFCVHHTDQYPRGNAAMGPDAPLDGRRIGSDFSGKDGWSMYHGTQIPGFPRHPHRGFETVTISRYGLVDHSDSLGATARFGNGDTQWMTAGRGIVHAEMFPLRSQDAPNPLDFFQVWLNLPQKSKFVNPHFTMMWDKSIPTHQIRDEGGREVVVRTIAGQLRSLPPAAPPPDSWASDPSSQLAIWTIDLAPGAVWTLPAADVGVNRALYIYGGDHTRVGQTIVSSGHRAVMRSDAPLRLEAGNQRSELLLLQGRPIGEPVARHGPFVMNTHDEIKQAYTDYRRTGFGGWPWQDDAPVHARVKERFAIHADGRIDHPS